MKKSVIAVGCLISLFLLSGCATSRKVQVVQFGDNKMSCDQLQSEFQKLDQVERDVDSKKGMTGTNVAAGLFWMPGLLYTYYDAGQATQAIQDRRAYLTKLYNDKNCE